MTFEVRRCAYSAAVGLAWILLLLLVALHKQFWILRIPSRPALTHVMKVPPGSFILGAVDLALDSPRPGGTGQIVVPVHSFVDLRGWATSTVPGKTIQRVSFILDGRTVCQQTHFYPRFDVAAAFARPDFAMSGWEMSVKLDDIDSGQHWGRVEAADSDGRTAPLRSLELAVIQ